MSTRRTKRAKPRNDGDRIADVWRVLKTVADPEIPVLPIVDLGMIADVRLEQDAVVVDMTPTFAGCPALDMIRTDIRRAVLSIDEPTVQVNTVFDPPWNTDRITEEGRRILKSFGLAPPGARCGAADPERFENTPCPFCDSTNTNVESMFGPTLCRSIHYCNECKQSFEHFKAL